MNRKVSIIPFIKQPMQQRHLNDETSHSRTSILVLVEDQDKVKVIKRLLVY
jgi:hypothetical protein